jgi:DNA-binding PadR family transcriptional regulator
MSVAELKRRIVRLERSMAAQNVAKTKTEQPKKRRTYYRLSDSEREELEKYLEDDDGVLESAMRLAEEGLVESFSDGYVGYIYDVDYGYIDDNDYS